MANLNIHVEGLSPTLGSLTGLDADLDNRYEPLDESARYMIMRAVTNFASNGGEFEGEYWAPLELSTVMHKAKYYPGTESSILYRTGELVNSFIFNDLEDGKSVVVTNTAPYYEQHQSPDSVDRTILPFGNTSISPYVLPRRVMMKIDNSARIDITRKFDDWAKKIIKRNFH